MATTSTTPSSPWSFFQLPAPIRQIIYVLLLAPHPEEDITTINYELRWTWLENPSNTTFAGIQQIDLCRCPQQQLRTHNAPTEDHIYTRYQCHGPEVRFKSAAEDLWALSPGYASSGQINFLRPATKLELQRRPRANILSTCKTVYKEAAPFLYRGRNFLFLTGPCPRGRYQAYATQTFLARLTPLARLHVTALSINALNYEEDCRVEDTGGAYSSLATYIEHHLPSFRTLCFNLWDKRLRDPACLLHGVLVKEGTSICLATDPVSGRVVECKDPRSYAEALRDVGADLQEHARHVHRQLPGVTNSGRKDSVRPRATNVWKEVDAGEEGWDFHSRPRPGARSRRKLSVQEEEEEEEENDEKEEEDDDDDDDDDEWVDATLSPLSVNGGKSGDEGSWEVL